MAAVEDIPSLTKVVWEEEEELNIISEVEHAPQCPNLCTLSNAVAGHGGSQRIGAGIQAAKCHTATNTKEDS